MLNLLEARLRINELARNWNSWSKRIADTARMLIGPCEVYAFGSAVRGQATGASDIDILIISSRIPKDCKSRGNLKAKLEGDAGLPLYHPFEIHLATDEEARENPAYRSAIQEGVAL